MARMPFVALALAALSALGPACGRDGRRGDEHGAITGAGATFPYPLYTKWISEFTRDRPGLEINYQSIGSGGGIRQLTERTVDFGASDVPMTDEQLARAPGIVHIPTCLGAVTLAYNLEGVPSGLKITPEAAAGIFLGTVQTWDDPAIQRENPGVPLPARRIIAVHRSDGSGTTRLFTEWLQTVSPAWKAGRCDNGLPCRGPGAGMSVAFPSGLGAKGNEGVAGQVAGTPGAIGYVELVYAVQSKLPQAALRNAAGAFVLPTPESITAAGAAAALRMPDDLRGSVVNAEGEGAYPIVGLSYVLLRERQDDPARGRALVGFLRWAIHDGQSFAHALHYAPLPPGLVKRIDDKLARIAGPDDRPLVGLATP
jgi:phosphate transport system substrate-binding protein